MKQINRITGPYSYASAHEPRRMTDEQAARLYQKLSPYLRVVSPWGYYLPKKRGCAKHDVDDWPLAFRDGKPPCPITWNPKLKARRPTYAEFLKAYGITVAEFATGPSWGNAKEPL